MSPDAFFTIDVLATVSGCAGLVWVLVNGFRRFFGLTMPWLFLVVSFAVNAAIYMTANEQLPSLAEGLVLIGNTFIVALAALGLQEAAVNGPNVSGGAEKHGREPVGWFTSWLSR